MKLLPSARRARVVHFLPWLLRYALAFLVEVAQRRLRERLPAHQYDQKRKRIPQQPRQETRNSRATRAMQELHGALPCSTFQIASC